MSGISKEEKVRRKEEVRQAKADRKAAKAREKALKPFYKRVWFWLLIVVAIIIVIAVAGSGNPTVTDEENAEYIEQSEIASMFKDPDQYEGKFVKITGQVLSVEESEGFIEVTYDVINMDDDYVVFVDGDIDVEEGDYVIVDGQIKGEQDFETILGTEISCPAIAAKSIQESTYEEAGVPALETRKVGKTFSSHGVDVTVDHVDFCENETRIYLTVKNSNSYTVDASTYSASVVQDGKEIEQSMSGEDLPTIEEVSGGASKDGVIVMEKMNSDTEMTLSLELMDYDNYEWDDTLSMTF